MDNSISDNDKDTRDGLVCNRQQRTLPRIGPVLDGQCSVELMCKFFLVREFLLLFLCLDFYLWNRGLNTKPVRRCLTGIFIENKRV